MNNQRRNFFKTLGTAAAGVAAIHPFIKPSSSSAALATSYRAAFLNGLVLGETIAGMLREVDGGDAVGIIVNEAVDESGVIRKHIGNVKYEEISIVCGAEMSPAFFEWIAQFLNRNPVVRDGAVLAADAVGRTQSQLAFRYALLTEIVFPELDAVSKSPASFALKLAPELTQIEAPSVPFLSSSSNTKSKQWMTSNYRVNIGGIPAEATARVSKVEAISVKQKIAVDEPGEIRDPFLDVEPLEVGNITLSVPERFAQPFIDWHRSFVIQGINTSENETYMTIEYLGLRGEVLFSLLFFGVGIFRTSRLGETDKRINQRIVEVGLYAETIAFFVGAVPSS